MRSQSMSRFAAPLAAALLFGLAHSATAGSLFSQVPVVTVPVSGLESQAQLADQLRAEGFDHVVFAASYPNLANPAPQLLPASAGNSAETPVHDGWNGVAIKNGKTFQVYTTHS